MKDSDKETAPLTILITGATDGIGLETAKMLAEHGDTLLIHGRNPAKLDAVQSQLQTIPGAGPIETYCADFSNLDDIQNMADTILKTHDRLDVLINNAGVFKSSTPVADNGLDTRFMVNLIAPAALTERLLPIIPPTGRVISLSSAAQAPINIAALEGQTRIGDMPAYSQSKLAITMWSQSMAEDHKQGPIFIAVNPGSLLATNMVRDGFGVAGSDVKIGAEILTRLAIGDDAQNRSGQYYDNDARRYAPPHPDAQDGNKVRIVLDALRSTLNRLNTA